MHGVTMKSVVLSLTYTHILCILPFMVFVFIDALLFIGFL